MLFPVCTMSVSQNKSCFCSSAQVLPKVFKSINFSYAREEVHQSMGDVDPIYHTALYHACDHSSWPLRICNADLQLAGERPGAVRYRPRAHRSWFEDRVVRPAWQYAVSYSGLCRLHSHVGSLWSMHVRGPTPTTTPSSVPAVGVCSPQAPRTHIRNPCGCTVPGGTTHLMLFAVKAMVLPSRRVWRGQKLSGTWRNLILARDLAIVV